MSFFQEEKNNTDTIFGQCLQTELNSCDSSLYHCKSEYIHDQGFSFLKQMSHKSEFFFEK